MPALKRAFKGTIDFLVDYCQRHAHPVNAFLHIFGVPMAFYGFFKLLTGKFVPGLELVFAGYLLQYLGHKVQGNEVGEVTLIKSVYRRLTHKSKPMVATGESPLPAKGGRS